MEGTKSKLVDQSLSAESYGLLKPFKKQTTKKQNKTLSFCRYRFLGPTCRYISPSPWISFGPWRACQCLMFTVKDELTIIMNNNAACDRCFIKWRPRCSLGRNNGHRSGPIGWFRRDWFNFALRPQKPWGLLWTGTYVHRNHEIIRGGNSCAQKPWGLLGTGTYIHRNHEAY